MEKKPTGKQRLWLALSVPCLLLAVLFAFRAAYLYTAILAVLGVGLFLRAVEDYNNPPDE